MTVTLRDITAQTVRTICALEPKDAQKDLVSPNAISIAQAYFNPSARFRAIHADEIPVGFIMWRPETRATCMLWRLMIDGRYQGQGHGRTALMLAIEAFRAEGFTQLLTSYVDAEGGPVGFYKKLGFQETGETNAHGERIMLLHLDSVRTSGHRTLQSEA